MGGTRTTNTFQEALNKIREQVSELKTFEDVDVETMQWVIQFETQVIAKIREPFQKLPGMGGAPGAGGPGGPGVGLPGGIGGPAPPPGLGGGGPIPGIAPPPGIAGAPGANIGAPRVG